MYGRYGSDQLNMAILVAAVLVSLTNSVLTVFLRESTVYSGIVAPILSVIVYGLLIYSFFRMFSRNIYKRQRENRRFTQLWMRLKDRNNRYFRCPNCKQTVRVPRGAARSASAAPSAARSSHAKPEKEALGASFLYAGDEK